MVLSMPLKSTGKNDGIRLLLWKIKIFGKVYLNCNQCIFTNQVSDSPTLNYPFWRIYSQCSHDEPPGHPIKLHPY